MGGNGVHKVSVNAKMTEDEYRALFYKLLAESRINKSLYRREKGNSILEELVYRFLKWQHSIRIQLICSRSNNSYWQHCSCVSSLVQIRTGRKFPTSAVYGTLDGHNQGQENLYKQFLKMMNALRSILIQVFRFLDFKYRDGRIL